MGIGFSFSIPMPVNHNTTTGIRKKTTKPKIEKKKQKSIKKSIKPVTLNPNPYTILEVKTET